MKIGISVISLVCLTGLAACGGGGGGGGSSPTATVASQTVLTVFPLQSGYKALVSKATTTNYTISGTCNGAATYSYSIPSGVTFEGAPALSKTTIISGSFTNCLPATFASSGVNYYDSNYDSLGSSTSTEYGKFLVAPQQLPTSIKLGDTAVYGSETLYTDSTKTTPIGRNDLSYIVELDGTSNNSAIVNLITKNYNLSNQILFTYQGRYRIVTDGTLSPVSIDVKYSTTGTTHLLFTAN